LAGSLRQELLPPRRSGIWAATILLFVGAVIAALLIVKVTRDGGSAAYQVARLGLLVPVLVVTALAALSVLGVRGFQARPEGILLSAVLAGAVGNLVLPFAVLGAGAWGRMIPLTHPVGIDFRLGLYEPAVIFSAKNSAWPPFNLVLGKLFTTLNETAAYWVQAALLVVLALAAVVLIADVGRRASGASAVTGKILAVAFGLWLLTSYGFLFEVERGNLDVYALFFSLLAVWLLVRHPRYIWLPALCLAIATNIKVYPGVLLVLLFWRHRWRAIIPVVVLNAALLLAAGPRNLSLFIHNNLQIQSDPALWLGNHSAQSFAHSLHVAVAWIPESSRYLFLAVPIVVWLATVVVVVRQGWDRRGAVLVAAASVPLMNVVPAVSHDYKLVLLAFPLAVLGFLLSRPEGGRSGSRAWRSSLLFLTGLCMALVSVSTLFWARGGNYPQAGYGNKYPLIVLVQVLLLIVALSGRGTPESAPPPARLRRWHGRPVPGP
jgi:hypothetical protein